MNPELLICGGSQVPASIHLTAKSVLEAMCPPEQRGLKNITWTCPTAARRTKISGYNASFYFEQPGDHRIGLTIADRGDANPKNYGYVAHLGPNTRRVVTVRPGDAWTMFDEPSIWVNFAAGQHSISKGATVHGSNMVITSDQGATIYWAPADAQDNIFSLWANDIVIRGLNLDARSSSSADKGKPTWVKPRRFNTTVLDLHATKFNDFINCDGLPTGLLIDNIVGPTVTYGGFGYGVWMQGRAISIFNAILGNVTGQHCIRNSGTDEFLISGNDLTNLDTRLSGGPAFDTAKGEIVDHKGQYGWIERNTCHANVHTGSGIGCGPLTSGTEGVNSGFCDFRVIKDNNVQTDLTLYPGARHGRLVGNRCGRMLVQTGDVTVPHRTIEDWLLVGNIPGKLVGPVTDPCVKNVRYGS